MHPFPDGNGRCARILLNLILEINGYKEIIINYTDSPRYYESLDKYATNKGLDDFYNLILENEYEVLEDYKNEIDKAKAYGYN
ncbi:Fic family protein [uncultured Anaerococcus sp.]|uniref:Fic family protein n=1 Tax=uncultured Anaerococcus sp. TaxID=293428 RepID=UPI0037DCB415